MHQRSVNCVTSEILKGFRLPAFIFGKTVISVATGNVLPTVTVGLP